MSPYPFNDTRGSPKSRHSTTEMNGTVDHENNIDDIPGIAIISRQLPTVGTQDPLISSDQSVYCEVQESDDLQTPRLSTCRRVLYGLAAPPSPMCFNILGFLMTVYLLETAQLPPKYILALAFAGRFWDAISDPIVGFLVQRTRTRFGQCRIWVVTAAPFCGISFFLFFLTPELQSVQAKFVYYFVIYFAFCTFVTTYHIPYTSMTMQISDRPVDRDAATMFRMVFEMIGTLFGVMVFTFITQHGPDRCDGSLNDTTVGEVTMEEKNRYKLGAGIIGVLVILCGLVGFFGTKEVVQSAPKAEEVEDKQEDTMLRTFRRCLRHPSYRILMLTFMLSSLAIQIVQNTLALYTIYSLNMKLHLKFAIAIVMSTSILVSPCVFRLIKRFGKKHVYRIGLLLILPVCASALVCPADPAWVPMYYATMVLAGCFVSINMLLPWMMLPDVIDDYKVAGGHRDQAAFYSLYVFFNKFAVGVSAALLQLALHVAGYRQAPACTQPLAVGHMLRIILGGLPIGIVLLALVLLHWYPITPEYRLELTMKLEKMQSGRPGGESLQLGGSDGADSEASATGCQEPPPEMFDSCDRILDSRRPAPC